MSSTGLTGKKFVGKIVKGFDSNQRGMYYVHCPELLPHIAESKGIICTNSIHPFRLTKSDRGMYGSYYPLHPGTVVQFECLTDDASAGRILSIVSDDQNKSDLDSGFVGGVIPTNKDDNTDGERKTYSYEESVKGKSEDRDEQYILCLTPDRNSIYINEKSGENPDSIFIVYHAKQSVIRIWPDGISISTDNNLKERIVGIRDIVINGHSSIMVTGGNYDVYVNGDINFHATGKINLLSDSEINIKSAGDLNLQSDGGSVNIKGSSNVNIQSGEQTNINAGSSANFQSAGSTNLKAGGNVNAQADGEANIKAASNVNMQSDATTNIKSASDTKLQSDGNTEMKSTGATNIQSDGHMNMKTDGNLNLESTDDANVKSSKGINIESFSETNISSATIKAASKESISLNAGKDFYADGNVISFNGGMSVKASGAGSAGSAAEAGAAGTADEAGTAKDAEKADPVKDPVAKI